MGLFDFMKPKTITIVAPCSGTVVPITEVPDPTFSEKILGDGFAIEPTSGTFISPCEGKITTLPNSLHAFAIETKAGISILVHVGLETVSLKGKPFQTVHKVGDHVQEGEEILVANMEALKKEKHVETITPILVLEDEKISHITLVHEKPVNIEAGQPLFIIHLK